MRKIRFPTDSLVISEARVACPDTDAPEEPLIPPHRTLAGQLLFERALAQIHYARLTGHRLPPHVARDLPDVPLEKLIDMTAAGYLIFGLAKDDEEALNLVKGVLDQVVALVHRKVRER